MKLLAGAPPHDLDVDVAVRVQAREVDHRASQLDDSDRLSHVEHEDLRPARRGAAGRQRAGADDQLDGLGDRHEVAGHPLVGDGHGSAALYLATEDRHDAARGAEHIAEAHGGVAACPGSAPWRPRARTRRAPWMPPSRSPEPPPCRLRRARSGAPGTGRRHAPRRASRSRCFEPPRPDWPPSAPRACMRRRGRRRSADARRRPRACAPPPCSRPARPPASSRAHVVRPRARAGSRRGCPRRGRAARSCAAPRGRSAGRAPTPIEPPAPVTSTI